jgi:hypothetical protein
VSSVAGWRGWLSERCSVAYAPYALRNLPPYRPNHAVARMQVLELRAGVLGDELRTICGQDDVIPCRVARRSRLHFLA